MGTIVSPVRLKPETLKAFDEYILAAEKAMAETLAVEFLWSERKTERIQQVRKGAILAEYWSEEDSKNPVGVPDGLIHDWVGATFVPASTVKQCVALLQDYANHKNVYKPEVIESELVSRSDDRFQVYLRLLKKKIITVVLDTSHDVLYMWPAPHRAVCCSHSTQVVEVEHAGTPTESKAPPDTGYGFLWRLYSYWRLEERDGGVFVECRAISLSRDVPAILSWVINPIVRKLPKESLIQTLEATQRALARMAQSELERVLVRHNGPGKWNRSATTIPTLCKGKRRMVKNSG
jgi:hypothetical protein